jgi:hypothetical protein
VVNIIAANVAIAFNTLPEDTGEAPRVRLTAARVLR